MKRTFSIVSAVLAASWIYPLAAQGQSVQAETESRLENVIVTARRREENIQNTPVAVTAFSGAQLSARGIDNVQELTKITPGFTLASANGSTLGGTATIRAQSQPESGEASLDPSVGFYIDDVYIARTNGIFPGLFDIQSVQTLKGPQGTLFGRNTTGGAVVVTTNQPALGVFSGFGKALYGNYDALQFQGGLNIPVGERFAIRAGGVINRRDGFAVNVLNGHEYENEHNEAYRVQALFQISDSTKLTLAYNGADADQGGVSYYLSEVDTDPTTGIGNNISLAQAAAAGGSVNGFTSLNDVFLRQRMDRRKSSANVASNESLKIESFAATLDSDLGGANVKFIAAHRKLDSSAGYDNDAGPFGLNEIDPIALHSKQSSAELRVSGTALDDRLSWITGGYYLLEKAYDYILFNQVAGTAFLTFDSHIRNETYSGFAQVDYELTDKLSATAGLRVGRDNREVENRHTLLAGGFLFCSLEPAINVDSASGGCRSNARAGFTQHAYQLGLNYQASTDLLLYATHKRGFRSGVLNERAVELATARPFEPEVIYDFEIGSKWTWHAGSELRGHINSAAYYSIFKNRQVSFIDVTAAGTVTTVLESADKAHTWGFEVEATAEYGNWLSFWASVAHTDPKYDKFSRRANSTQPAVDVSHQPVSQVAKWQYSVGTRVETSLGAAVGIGFAQTNWSHQSGQFFGFGPRPSASDPGHGLLDAAIGVENVGGRAINVSAFGKNLLDKEYPIQAINLGFAGEPSQAFFGFANAALGPPRTYGIQLDFQF